LFTGREVSSAARFLRAALRYEARFTGAPLVFRGLYDDVLKILGSLCHYDISRDRIEPNSALKVSQDIILPLIRTARPIDQHREEDHLPMQR
jgi:hypothetical protein